MTEHQFITIRSVVQSPHTGQSSAGIRSFAMLLSCLMVITPGNDDNRDSSRWKSRKRESNIYPDNEKLGDPQADREDEFTCPRCGALVMANIDECPYCRARHIPDHLQDDRGEYAEGDLSGPEKKIFSFEDEKITCGHFDVENGIIFYAEDSEDDVSKGLCKCGNCGVHLKFLTLKCPLCGNDIHGEMSEIAESFFDAEVGEELEEQLDSELTCPVCGELAHLRNGRCTKCNTQLISIEDDPRCRIRPILSLDSLVFVHLNVANGEVRYFRKGEKRLITDSFTLELVEGDKNDIDWENLGEM